MIMDDLNAVGYQRLTFGQEKLNMLKEVEDYNDR